MSAAEPMPNEAESVLDTSGLTCPLPFLLARRRLRLMMPGAVLTIFATDPEAGEQMAELCASAGHVLISSSRSDGVDTFLIQRGDRTD